MELISSWQTCSCGALLNAVATDPAACNRHVAADNTSAATHSLDKSAISFRLAGVEDAAAIWQLVRATGVLDENSRYCYLLLCRDFGDTCLVACRDNVIVGFVAAYVPPKCPDCIFVWQVGVAEAVRGQGVAKALLRALVTVPACEGVRFLEATVTPSNTASRRLFESFAESLEVPCDISQGFTADMFGDVNHEREDLFRIGPLVRNQSGLHSWMEN